MVIDHDGLDQQVPKPLPDDGPDLDRMGFLVEEFYRTFANFTPAVLARQDWLLGVVGVQANRQMLYDLFVQARDDKGNSARATAELNGDPFGENIILRLDRAIYRAGDSLQIETRSSTGLPTVYFDVIKNGQTLLTKWIDFKDGAPIRAGDQFGLGRAR